MRKVLWISRHRPIPAEEKELSRLLKDYRLYTYTEKVEIREENEETSPFMEFIKKLKPDIIIPVVPLSVTKLLVDLSSKYHYEVWEATFEPVKISNSPEHDEEKEVAVQIGTGKYRIYRFKGFSRIKKFVIEKELITEPL
jgi:hypothetical protein